MKKDRKKAKLRNKSDSQQSSEKNNVTLINNYEN